jgi:DNA-binding SARP family transcriptional activator
MIRVRVLGPLAAEVDGRAVDLGGPRQRAVLALLIAARGDVVPVDRLIDDLWRGEPPPKASASLQAYVSNLRRLLEPGRQPRTPARVLVSAPPGYAIRLDTTAVDAWRFEADLRVASQHDDPHDARAGLAAALEHWRGPAFAEVADEPWATAEAARLAELRIVARERLVEATIRAGAAAEAVPVAQVLTREHPLREEAWRLLALALYATGRQADALAALREARRMLADELGLDPGSALVELESAILAQRVPAMSEEDVRRRTPAPSGATASDTAPLGVPDELFVGRDAELDGLVRAVAGGTAVALIAGEAGAGKSALLRAFGGRLAGSGWRVVAGRCPEADGAPPAWAWTEALRELQAAVPPLADLVPALEPLLLDGRDPAPQPARAERAPSGPSGRFRLHRAVGSWLRAASAAQPLAVLLDDVHRGDAETLAVLASVAAEVPGTPVLLVAAYRAEHPENPLGGQLGEALAELARFSPHRVILEGLARAEAARLVTAVAGVPVDDDTVAALAERTGGNPFYLRESARLLASEGALVAMSDVPYGVRDVLRRRLARLPPPAVAVLRLAAAIGREADVDLIVSAADTDEDGVLDALETGLIAGLLTEPGPSRVRFVHALVRDTLYSDLSHLRRARVHARIAAALERLRPHDLPALAHHYAHGLTAATAERAVAANLGAAELAERRYAYDTAAGLYEQALTCLDRVVLDAAGDLDARRVDLLGRVLRARVNTGEVPAARVVRERAVAVAEAADRDDLLLAALTAWTVPSPWEVHAYAQVDHQLVARLERQLARGDLDDVTRCRLLGALCGELSGESDPRAMDAALTSLDLARAAGDPELLALALMTTAREMSFDRQAEARERLGAELAELGSRPGLVAYRWYAEHLAASVAVTRLDLPAMHRHTVTALELARSHQLGEPHDVALSGLGTYAHITGDLAAAERIYREVGEHMRRKNSLHVDYEVVATFTVRASQGRLGELVPLLREMYAERPPLVAEPLAVALVASGRPDEARRVRGTPMPLRHDYFAALWATIRTMAVCALDLRGEAEELIEFFEPIRDQLPSAATTSVAMRPVAHSLGELSRLLGRERDAADYFAHAVTVAQRCSSPHWAEAARAALAALQARSK